jgi:hypothetical protein
VSDKLVEGLRKRSEYHAADRIEELERALKTIRDDVLDYGQEFWIDRINALLTPSAAPEPQKGPYPPR